MREGKGAEWKSLDGFKFRPVDAQARIATVGEPELSPTLQPGADPLSNCLILPKKTSCSEMVSSLYLNI